MRVTNMGDFLRRRVELVLICILVVLVALLYETRGKAHRVTEAEGGGGLVLILDAGHGGEDAGAIGVNGVYEKDLNLQIAYRLAALAEEAGYSVLMTRTDDRLLYKEEENIKGHRKEYDLKNRLEISEQYPTGILISIHMNSFSSSRYSGLQVWYAETEGSMALAQSIQGEVKKQLQPDNHRAIKAAGSSMYLLYHSTHAAVLIECGFLSHEQECALLTTENYQKELSYAIFCGIMEYVKKLDSTS